MDPRKRELELEARRLKTAKIWIKKRIEKEKEVLSDIGEENMLKVLTGKAPKVYKRKNRDRTIKSYG